MSHLNGLFGNSTWQTGKSLLVKNSRQHIRTSWQLSIAEGSMQLMKPRLSRGMLCPLICISLRSCLWYSSWWCVDTHDDMEESSTHWSSPIRVHHESSTNFPVESCSLTIGSVDHCIAGKRVGGNNTQMFWWHWPADGESLFPIVSSILNMTIMSIMNATIAGLPNPSWTMWELEGCQKEPNGGGGLHLWNFTSIFDDNNIGGCVLVAKRFPKPGLLCIIDYGQQANSISGGQSPIYAGHSYLSRDDILPHHPRMESTIFERNRIMMSRCGTQMQEGSWLWNQDFKRAKHSIKEELSHSSSTLKSSGMMLLVVCLLWPMSCCWWECSLPIWEQSHYEFS